MSAIGFGIPMQFDKAYAEGITKLTREDIRYAEELGYRIKLLGITRRTKAGIELRVHPTLIPHRRLIANVEGAMNAVVVQGDAVIGMVVIKREATLMVVAHQDLLGHRDARAGDDRGGRQRRERS